MTDSAGETYDVFLSHAHTEAEAVELLATKLEDEARLVVWLGRWILVPGGHWQQEMARGLDQAKTCAVCMGSRTPSGWFREEIERVLNRQTRDKEFRVIPIILPDGNRGLVDNFLELRTWVDFGNSLQDADAFHRLVCGVRGLPPGRRLRVPLRPSEELAAIRAKLSNIAERLAQAEPDRADYQVDLAISLYRAGIAGDSFEREPIERALEILLALQEAGRLAPEDESKIPALREVLRAGGVE